MNYKFAYALGFHPWEDAEAQPSFAEKFGELLEGEESGREPPYGAALDLGTGSGIWGIKLAERGWQATGSTSSKRRFSAAASEYRMPASTCAWCMET